MIAARVQKPAESAPSAPAKKTPFFPAAAVQPKLSVHKPEGASAAAVHAPTPVSAPAPRALPVVSSEKNKTASQPTASFFKPVAVSAQTAIVRNLYEAKPSQAEAIAPAPAPTNKPELIVTPVAGVTPVINISDKAGATAVTGAGVMAQPTASPASQTAAAHKEPAVNATADQVAQSAAPSPADVKNITPQSEKPQAEGSKAEVTDAETKTASGKGAQAAAPAAEGGTPEPADPGSPYKHLKPAATEAVFQSKLQKAGTLAHKTAATKSAAEKIEESKQAQDTPASESQAKSNEGQVGDFNSQRKDPKTEDEAKHTLDDAITANMPTTLKAVDEFKESGKGKDISKTVMGQVNSDVADVKASYQGIGTAPAPAPPEKGAGFPPQEEAEPVGQINMGAGVVPPVEAKELDTRQYAAESDNLVKQEGITQEHLDLVDSGDLANANKERKALQKDAVSQPAEVQQMAVHEHKKLDADLKVHETNSRAEMHGHRNQHLSQTSERQRKAKEDLEKKREEVAKNINDRYKACQASIMSKLDNLERSSLAQFDAGQAKATSEFEDQVNNDIDKFKDKRYDRIGGSLLWLKDKLFGIDDFPEVVKAFNDARQVFTTKIDALIATITKANNEVIAACKKELEDTKAGIRAYVDSLGPQLKDAAKKAEDEVNKKLQELGSEIDKRKEKLQQVLADRRKAAMEAIDKKIEAMKEKMKGAISIIGNLLLQAALKFFKWALQAAGLSPDNIMGVINKGVTTIKTIINKPMVFVGNLIDAAKLGFKNFGKNFLTHLKDAVFGWLTGALEGVHLPKVWDGKGILMLVLDILGLTYPAIRVKMVALMGETAVKVLENGFALVKTLVTEGPAAAWEQLKGMADEIKNTFIDAVKEWIRNTIIFKAIEAIVSIFVPGAGIVKAIIGIYDTVMFFVQKAKQIAQMVGGFLDSVSDIVAGKIDNAAGALENGLATALQLVISFLAKLLHLDGITDKIKKAIETIRAKVSNALDKVVLWIKNMAGKLVNKGKEAVASATGWLKDLLGIEEKFDAEDGTGHRLYFAPEGDQVELMLNPSPAGTFEKWINSIPLDENAPGYEKKKAKKNKAIQLGDQITAKRKLTPPVGLDESKAKEWEKQNLKDIKDLLKLLSKETGSLFGGKIPDCANEGAGNLKFGGLTGGYGTSMKASYLTKKKLPDGSVPGVSSDAYDIINQRKHGSGSYYIKGHLLNRLLGGTGNDWHNLTPLTRKANSEHERIAESAIKNAVKEGNIISYSVEAVYGGRKVQRNPRNKTVDQIMGKEVQVPTHLIAQADLVTVDSSDKIVKKAPLVPGTKINNDITDPPEY